MTQSNRSVALVTGAARRIGAVIARRLHQRGLDIALHYHRSLADARALGDELERARADSVRLIQADLKELEQLAKIVAQIRQWRGRL
ncbi:MAG: SDR family NAD(P)-dependent oxidoreductase, partial [Halioglobus sp.]|nr:SDR family NAD(P)-dependent oxidoreductase [Halioglobus sp.]